MAQPLSLKGKLEWKRSGGSAEASLVVFDL